MLVLFQHSVLSVWKFLVSCWGLTLFLQVIASLWILSVLGSCCNFLTLFYIGNACDSSVTNVSLGVDWSFERNFMPLLQSLWHCTLYQFCMRNMRTRLMLLVRRLWLNWRSIMPFSMRSAYQRFQRAPLVRIRSTRLVVRYLLWINIYVKSLPISSFSEGWRLVLVSSW